MRWCLVSIIFWQRAIAYYLPSPGYYRQRIWTPLNLFDDALANCNTSNEKLDVLWLSCRTSQIIEECKELCNSKKCNDTNTKRIFTPDATHAYGAQWTRDLYYTVNGAPDLMRKEEVFAAVNYTFRGQRSDGCMPDRVQINGNAPMAPGAFNDITGKGVWKIDHAWDNGPFSALLLAATMKAWPDRSFFCSFEPAVQRALNFVNRSEYGLVFNDFLRPNSTYGFTDTVAKGGNLLFTSLVLFDASEQMAGLSSYYKCGDVKGYSDMAYKVKQHIDILHDPHSSLWLAASVTDSQPDVWGSAYLVALGLSTLERRAAAMKEMVENPQNYFRAGQVRSLPAGMYWDLCINVAGVGPGLPCGTVSGYQNGGYWATPLPYMVKALISTGHTDWASALVEDTIENFKAMGIYEWVGFDNNPATLGVLNYTASASNTLLAARLLQEVAKTTKIFIM